MMQLQNDFPRLAHFVCIRRAEYDQPGYGSHMCEMLDRLMGGPIFPHTDRIMSEHIDGREFHQRAQPQRTAHVVNKDEEPRAEWPKLHYAHSVQDCAHCVLADSEMKIASSIVFGRKVSRAILCDASLCRWCKVRRSSDQPGNVLGGGIQYHAGGLSGRQAFRVGLELG